MCGGTLQLVRTNRPAPLGPVIPELAYPDVSAAVDWLVEVLGFIERVRIAPRHRAQLSFGGGSLIVADVGHGRVAQTGERSVMLRVDDVASLCERVRTERRHDPPATARVSVRGAAVHLPRSCRPPVDPHRDAARRRTGGLGRGRDRRSVARSPDAFRAGLDALEPNRWWSHEHGRETLRARVCSRSSLSFRRMGAGRTRVALPTKRDDLRLPATRANPHRYAQTAWVGPLLTFMVRRGRRFESVRGLENPCESAICVVCAESQVRRGSARRRNVRDLQRVSLMRGG